MPITPPPLRVLKPTGKPSIDKSHTDTPTRTGVSLEPTITVQTPLLSNPCLSREEAWPTRLWRRRGRLPRMIAVRALIGAGALGLQSVAGESVNTALAAMGLGTLADLLRTATAWLPWSNPHRPY